MRKDASQIVPPRSSDPMKEGPLCRIRREARARGAVAALVSENLNAVDFNRPNRDARLLRCYGVAVTRWHDRRRKQPTERPMPQPNDLSRSPIALNQDGTLIAVIEMSQSSWLVAGIVPGIARHPLKKLAADAAALLGLLERWR